MIAGTNRLHADGMQSKRIVEHPFQTEDCLLVFDNLEEGTLRIYEPINGPVHIQQLFSRYGTLKNAVLVAEAVINSNRREKEVFVHKIQCNYGYESLIQPMTGQILHFADFYNYESAAISGLEYDKCLPYDKKHFENFQKVNRVYEYRLDGHTNE